MILLSQNNENPNTDDFKYPNNPIAESYKATIQNRDPHPTRATFHRQFSINTTTEKPLSTSKQKDGQTTNKQTNKQQTNGPVRVLLTYWLSVLGHAPGLPANRAPGQLAGEPPPGGWWATRWVGNSPPWDRKHFSQRRIVVGSTIRVFDGVELWGFWGWSFGLFFGWFWGLFDVGLLGVVCVFLRFDVRFFVWGIQNGMSFSLYVWLSGDS